LAGVRLQELPPGLEKLLQETSPVILLLEELLCRILVLVMFVVFDLVKEVIELLCKSAVRLVVNGDIVDGSGVGVLDPDAAHFVLVAQ
jgi:hypothetical protein